ncbi:energy transducer TonB [Chryseobacterium camelliae]|uniref:energy transducer TonB n=1 Tax=Chryseobacterium camelliae TaxID=1265445 RepID=UPI000C1CA5A4|nr:energy transducer TonB [Chryseobacterium camelliae]
MKNPFKNEESRFNELLFEHRNKEYGAYVLRNESDRILTKALFVGVSLLAAISITPLIVSAFKTTEVSIETPDPGPFVFKDIPEHEVVVPVKPTPPAAQQKKVKTFDETIPEPKANLTKEKVVEKIEGAVAGTRNNSDGETAPANTYVPQAPAINTGPVSIPTATTPVPEKADPNAVSTVVDVEASFPGGIDSFRNKVLNNFDGSGIDSDGVVKTMITFIVERDGSISAIKADGKNADFNSEALRTIKNIKGKWIPAKVKGQAVRSYFKFPISMKFEN